MQAQFDFDDDPWCSPAVEDARTIIDVNLSEVFSSTFELSADLGFCEMGATIVVDEFDVAPIDGDIILGKRKWCGGVDACVRSKRKCVRAAADSFERPCPDPDDDEGMILYPLALEADIAEIHGEMAALEEHKQFLTGSNSLRRGSCGKVSSANGPSVHSSLSHSSSASASGLASAALSRRHTILSRAERLSDRCVMAAVKVVLGDHGKWNGAVQDRLLSLCDSVFEKFADAVVLCSSKECPHVAGKKKSGGKRRSKSRPETHAERHAIFQNEEVLTLKSEVDDEDEFVDIDC